MVTQNATSTIDLSKRFIHQSDYRTGSLKAAEVTGPWLLDLSSAVSSQRPLSQRYQQNRCNISLGRRLKSRDESVNLRTGEQDPSAIHALRTHAALTGWNNVDQFNLAAGERIRDHGLYNYLPFPVSKLHIAGDRSKFRSGL